MNQKFELLVFDWDGTLMDSEARIVSCMRAAIADLSLDARDDASIRNIIGLGLAEAINTLYPGSDSVFHKSVIDLYRYHFLTADQTESELFAGVEQTLVTLAEAGYLLAVATGKGRVGLDKVLNETGLGRFFQATRCADETFSKPHPLMLEQLMDEMGVEPQATLMIGDTEYDMQMANNARAAALAVSYGVHEKARLMKHEPLHCIDAITELTDWLDSLGGERALAKKA